jgi:N-acetylglucosamine kinase-like BadF-type ATPase
MTAASRGSAAAEGATICPVAVIGIDVGNSKTDVALVSRSGETLAAVRGPTASHQQVGPEGAFATITALVERASVEAGLEPKGRPIADVIVCCAAGADFHADRVLLERGLAATRLAASVVVVNDCYAGLRAGTPRKWGVCVICGSGMNCLGIAPNGRAARFDALGEMSGDWGGGGSVGEAGLAAAVRAEDGRGPSSVLARLVPAYFGLRTPRALTAAMYRGTIPYRRHIEIAPLVFAAATAGDAVAIGIVDRQADEIVAWANAAIRRVRMQRLDLDVVLAGGIFRTSYAPLYERVTAGIRALAPAARVVRLTTPPVVGAVLLGFDRLHAGVAPAEIERRLRDGLTDERITR